MLCAELRLQRAAHVLQVTTQAANLVIARQAHGGGEIAARQALGKSSSSRSGRNTRERSSHSTSSSEASNWPLTVMP